MQKSTATYLYQYKNSSNYFFRLHLKNTDKTRYNDKRRYFVASLQTSQFDDARFLAVFIKRNLFKDEKMKEIVNQPSIKNELLRDSSNAGSAELKQLALDDLSTLNDSENNARFKKVLRDRFSLLLNAAKVLLEFGLNDVVEDFIPLTNTQKETFERSANEIVDIQTQQATLRMVTDNNTDMLVTNDNKQYLDYVSMLDALILQMGQIQQQLNTYTSNQPQVVTNHTDLSNLVIAMAQHQSIKEKVIEIESGNKEAGDNFFSIKNQLKMFLLEKTGQINPNTLSDYSVKFNVLFEVISPDYDCRAFNKQDVQKVKTMLLARPSNASKGCNDKTLNAKTINGYLSNYRTFFTWLTDNIDGLDKNPFADVSIKANEMTAIKRRPFKPEEVKRLLSYTPRHTNEAKLFRDDAKWYVPIALYTGMRLNEISSIRLDEIKCIDDVWCFDLTYQETKNLSSQRIVPIAQYLLDLGLLEYVESLKKAKKQLLFAQIRIGKSKPGKAGWGDPISRWFNRTILRNIGINVEEELRHKTSVVFHCIRHTMISTCIKRGAEKYLVKRIVGHSQDDQITLGVYSDVNSIDLKLLKQVLDDNLLWHFN